MSTHHFTGNYPPRCSIRAASLADKLIPRVGDRMGKAAPQHEMDEIAKLNSEVSMRTFLLLSFSIVMRLSRLMSFSIVIVFRFSVVGWS